jgi:hypothetical protein
MGGNRTHRSLSSHEEAVAEEFTALPALCVVVIGLTLFFLLLAHAYTAYQADIDTTRDYHTADLLTEKLLDPAHTYILPGGVVNLTGFTEASDTLTGLRQAYSPAGFDFLFRLTTNTTTFTIPTNATPPAQFIAASRTVCIMQSDAQTTRGTLTVLLWRTPG